MNDRNELITSIAAAAADIQRWSLQMATADRVSRDRVSDIKNSAERIGQLNAKLALIKE